MKEILIQPCYFSDILSYACIAQSEKIILETCDNYQKQTYRNRCIIGTANGTLSLTIPVKHVGGDGHKKTAEALIENNFAWQKEHWRSIQIAYRTSPFFEFYEDDIRFLYEDKFENLLHFNKETLRVVLDILQAEKEIEYTQSYVLEPVVRDRRYLAIAKRKRTVDLPAYNQVFEEKNGFIPHLSVLDLTFNLGPAALQYLENVDLG
ncbi:MAG: hypothetical protein CL868_20225 [Cytophagaceae bacterium]|nr:hypothetical protein [Cytophagaceae bacterium]